MCGIVYSQSFIGKPVSKTIIKRYLNQKNRGTEGFGFYVPETNRLTHNVKEGRILSLLKRTKESEVLFHHRFPTSTENVRNACHPFSTKDYYDHNYVVVHNGVVSNDYELADKHLAEGIEYVSMQQDGMFNDSEALAHDIAQYIEGKVDKLTARGSIAFIAVQRDKDGNKTGLYFGRNNGNPLHMKHTKSSLTLSSEGSGTNIEPNMLYHYDYAKKTLTSSPMTIPERVTYVGSAYTYPYTWDDSNKYSYVSENVSDLALDFLNEAYEDEWGAIELAKDALKELQNGLFKLEVMEMNGELDDKEEIEAYFNACDDEVLLKEVIRYLQDKVLRKTIKNETGLLA